MTDATIALPISTEADGSLVFSLGREVECTLTLPDGTQRKGWVSGAMIHRDDKGWTGEASVTTTFPYRLAPSLLAALGEVPAHG